LLQRSFDLRADGHAETGVQTRVLTSGVKRKTRRPAAGFGVRRSFANSIIRHSARRVDGFSVVRFPLTPEVSCESG
jgi:hypothetical protein